MPSSTTQSVAVARAQELADKMDAAYVVYLGKGGRYQVMTRARFYSRTRRHMAQINITPKSWSQQQ